MTSWLWRSTSTSTTWWAACLMTRLLRCCWCAGDWLAAEHACSPHIVPARMQLSCKGLLPVVGPRHPLHLPHSSSASEIACCCRPLPASPLRASPCQTARHQPQPTATNHQPTTNHHPQGFHKILKKHDKCLPHAPCRQFYIAHLHQQPWVQGNYSDLLVSLSGVYSRLRGDTSGKKNEDAAQVCERGVLRYRCGTGAVQVQYRCSTYAVQAVAGVRSCGQEGGGRHLSYGIASFMFSRCARQHATHDDSCL